MLTPRRIRRAVQLLLFVALVGLLDLALGVGFFAFLAFFVLLALLDDFGLGSCCGIGGHGVDGFLFFDLERDNVRDNAIFVGNQFYFGGVKLQFAGTQRLI